MKKVAIPVSNGLLSTHFGHAPMFYFYEIDDDRILTERMLLPPPHEHGSIPKWLAESGITDLIAGGIGSKAIDILNAKGINVFTGAHAKPPHILIKEFMNDKLETGDNYCDHDDSLHDHQ
jgi:predicted Fe-Mo cluster-binding NifX family protein